MTVVNAVRDKEAELLSQQDRLIEEMKTQCASQIETERKKIEMTSEQRCVARRNTSCRQGEF